MEFTTLYDHGDTIHFMSDSVPVEGVVRLIKIESTQVVETVEDEEVETVTTNIYYYCIDIHNPVEEGHAFATHEALLASLP